MSGLDKQCGIGGTELRRPGDLTQADLALIPCDSYPKAISGVASRINKRLHKIQKTGNCKNA